MKKKLEVDDSHYNLILKKFDEIVLPRDGSAKEKHRYRVEVREAVLNRIEFYKKDFKMMCDMKIFKSKKQIQQGYTNLYERVLSLCVFFGIDFNFALRI